MKKVLNSKFLFFIPLLIIMIISFLDMYNAKYLSTLYGYNLAKQIIWYTLGIIILLLFKKINTSFMFKYAKYFYILAILLLIYVLIFGKVINGARAWITIKGLSFGPSELAKLSLALMLSNTLNSFVNTGIKSEILFILKVFILTLIPSILVFLEPDTGAIIFFLVMAFTIVVLSNIHKFWYILAIIFISLLIGTFIFLYLFNKDLLINLIGTSFFYRVERLITFKTMSSYQLENALVGIGSSNALSLTLNGARIYIPEAPTDFVFAFSITNFGYITGFIILLCYLILDIYLINRFISMKKSTIKHFLACFINIFILNQIINIGMNLGLLPIIGIPLPFLSYGGSTLIIYFIFLGIIFNSKEKPY